MLKAVEILNKLKSSLEKQIWLEEDDDIAKEIDEINLAISELEELSKKTKEQ